MDILKEVIYEKIMKKEKEIRYIWGMLIFFLIGVY